MNGSSLLVFKNREDNGCTYQSLLYDILLDVSTHEISVPFMAETMYFCWTSIQITRRSANEKKQKQSNNEFGSRNHVSSLFHYSTQKTMTPCGAPSVLASLRNNKYIRVSYLPAKTTDAAMPRLVSFKILLYSAYFYVVVWGCQNKEKRLKKKKKKPREIM